MAHVRHDGNSPGYVAVKPARTDHRSAFYRFYPLRAEGRIADRREGYFADDAAAIAAARHVIEDFPRLEIWCGQRQVASLSCKGPVRLRSFASRNPPRAAVLISRNQRLRRQAAEVSRVTLVLCSLPKVPGDRSLSWSQPQWTHGRFAAHRPVDRGSGCDQAEPSARQTGDWVSMTVADVCARITVTIGA